MSSVALKILKKQTEGKLKKKNTNAENPLYEWVQVEKRNGKLKTERRERPLPQGLSANDQKILRHVRKRAYRLDMGFRLCCFNFRFGWSAIIGLLPVIGDALEVMMALSLIKTAAKVDGGLPKRLYSMMFANIMLDLAIGFVPILGDLVDFWYRANTRNAWLLDAYLTAKAEAIRKNVIVDPDTGEKVPVPPELLGAPTDGDVEQGVVQARPEPARSTPAVAPPAPGPAPSSSSKMYNAPPGRNLTGQATAGRPVQDPRDKRGRR